MKHLQLTLNELRDYQGELEKALKRYLKRIVWLLQGASFCNLPICRQYHFRSKSLKEFNMPKTDHFDSGIQVFQSFSF